MLHGSLTIHEEMQTDHHGPLDGLAAARADAHRHSFVVIMAVWLAVVLVCKLAQAAAADTAPDDAISTRPSCSIQDANAIIRVKTQISSRARRWPDP
jgi:hypothetical protein